MSDTTERLLIRIDATTEQLRRELKRADDEVQKYDSRMQAALAKMGAGWQRADKWVQRHSAQMKLMGAAAVGATGLALKAIVDYSDQHKQLQGQLKLVTDSQEELNAVWDRSLSLSNATGATMDSTVNLYARMARSTEELNLSQDDLFTITQAVNQSFVVSGASAQESSSAILQLSQGMAAGVLRGEELNSVMENSPRLARALADGLGVTIGQLREMGKAGELTTEAVVNALKTQSAAIDAEFQQMPMTVGRATNEMKNLIADAFGRADVDPLIEAIGELSGVVTDPETIEGLTQIAEAVVSIGSAAVQTTADLVGMTRWIAEGLARSVGGPAVDDMAAFSEKIAAASDHLKRLEKQGRGNTTQATKLRGEIKRLTLAYELNASLIEQEANANEEAARAKAENAESARDSQAAHDDLAGAVGRSTGASDAAAKAQERQAEQARRVKDALQFEIDQFEENTKQQFINAEVRRLGANATKEQIAEVKRLAAELFDLRQANTKTTDEVSKQWRDARETLSDFFFEIAKDGEDAFDTLVKGWSASLQKMLAEAATTELFKALGLPVEEGAVDFSALTGALKSVYDGVFSSDVSSVEVGSTPEADPTAGVSEGSKAASGGWEAGLIAFVAARVLGDLQNGTYTLGEALSGEAGRIKYGDKVGPLDDILFPGHETLMTSALSFSPSLVALYRESGLPSIGEFTEKFVDDLFGFGSGGNNKGEADFNLATGEGQARGVGKNFDQENVDTAQALLDAMLQFSEGIGGSSFSGQLSVGNKHGIQINGRKYSDPEDFFAYVFDEIIRGASGLDETLRDLLINFEGTADETMQMASAVRSLHENAQINSVTQAIEEFAAITPTALEAYRQQTAQVHTLIDNFDGSSTAALQLADALNRNKIAAYEYALSLQQVGASMAELTGTQAQDIRESVLTPTELFFKKLDERNQLGGQLAYAQDPDIAVTLLREIAELNRELYNLIPGAEFTPGQAGYLGLDSEGNPTAATANAFATFIEGAGTVFQDLVGVTLAELEGVQADLNTRFHNLLQETAGEFQRSAEMNLEASQNMLQASENLLAFSSEVIIA